MWLMRAAATAMFLVDSVPLGVRPGLSAPEAEG